MPEDQQRKCPICGEDLIIATNNTNPAVDHDHVTGKIRGLLHVTCNAMLGLAHDNPETLERAIAYLKANS